MAFDIEVALHGWPSRRRAMLEPLARRSMIVEYVVSARFTAGSVGLYWFFDRLGVRDSDRAH